MATDSPTPNDSALLGGEAQLVDISKSWSAAMNGDDRVKLKEVALMSRQLATMVASGLTLVRALGTIPPIHFNAFRYWKPGRADEVADAMARPRRP